MGCKIPRLAALSAGIAFLLAGCGAPGMIVPESSLPVASASASIDCNSSKISPDISSDLRASLEALIAERHVIMAISGGYDVESTYCSRRVIATLPVIDNSGELGTMYAQLASGKWKLGCRIDSGTLVILYGTSADSLQLTNYFRNDRSCPKDFSSGDKYTTEGDVQEYTAADNADN